MESGKTFNWDKLVGFIFSNMNDKILSVELELIGFYVG